MGKYTLAAPCNILVCMSVHERVSLNKQSKSTSYSGFTSTHFYPSLPYSSFRNALLIKFEYTTFNHVVINFCVSVSLTWLLLFSCFQVYHVHLLLLLLLTHLCLYFISIHFKSRCFHANSYNFLSQSCLSIPFIWQCHLSVLLKDILAAESSWRKCNSEH